MTVLLPSGSLCLGWSWPWAMAFLPMGGDRDATAYAELDDIAEEQETISPAVFDAPEARETRLGLPWTIPRRHP